jgi:hypothetical protein
MEISHANLQITYKKIELISILCVQVLLSKALNYAHRRPGEIDCEHKVFGAIFLKRY